MDQGLEKNQYVNYERRARHILYIHYRMFHLRAHACASTRIRICVRRISIGLSIAIETRYRYRGCVLCFINIHAPYAVQRSIRIASPSILDSLALILSAGAQPSSAYRRTHCRRDTDRPIDLSHSRPPSLNAPLVTRLPCGFSLRYSVRG